MKMKTTNLLAALIILSAINVGMAIDVDADLDTILGRLYDESAETQTASRSQYVTMASATTVKQPLGVATPQNATTDARESFLDAFRETYAYDVIRAHYQNDMQHYNGATKWHGKISSQAVEASNCVAIVTFADGYTLTNSFKRVTSQDEADGALAHLTRWRQQMIDKGVPTRLIDARIKTYKATKGAPQEVTVKTVVAPKKENTEISHSK